MKDVKFTMKQARLYRGWTQKEMAKKLGVFRNTYQAYEEGRIRLSIGRAEKFAKIVKVPIGDIIFPNKK